MHLDEEATCPLFKSNTSSRKRHSHTDWTLFALKKIMRCLRSWPGMMYHVGFIVASRPFLLVKASRRFLAEKCGEDGPKTWDLHHGIDGRRFWAIMTSW